jgi:hypothetical protein
MCRSRCEENAGMRLEGETQRNGERKRWLTGSDGGVAVRRSGAPSLARMHAERPPLAHPHVGYLPIPVALAIMPPLLAPNMTLSHPVHLALPHHRKQAVSLE